MPIFYTDVRTGTDFARAVEGEEFTDCDASLKSARDGARGTVSSEINAGRDPVSLEYFIRDEGETQLATFSVTATVSGLDPLN